jgi:hypothetical protein
MHGQKEEHEELVLPKTLATMTQRVLIEARLHLVNVALVLVVCFNDGRFVTGG